MAEHRVIGLDGIRTYVGPGNGNSGSQKDWVVTKWKDFVTADPEQQKTIMHAAGMDTGQQKQLLGLLKKNNNVTWTQGAGSDYPIVGAFTGDKGKGWVDKGYAQLSDELSNQWQARAQGNNDRSLSDIALHGVNAATKPAAAAPDPAQISPAYTKQSLDLYTNEYAKPMMQFLGQQISAQDSAINAAIGSVAKATGQTNSPLTHMVQQFQTMNQPTEQKLVDQTYGAAALTPYLSTLNSEIANQAKVGATQQALGQTAQNLYESGVIQQQLGLTGSGGSSAIAQILNPNGINLGTPTG